MHTGNTKSFTRFILAVCFGAVLPFASSCEKDSSSNILAGTRWRFIEHTDSRTGHSTLYPTYNDGYDIIFESKDTFSMPVYCNYSNGEYEISGSRISFLSIFPGTKVYCQGISEWESFFIPRLAASHSFLMEGNTLVISGDEGRLYFRRH